MKLKQLKKLIDAAAKAAGKTNPEVEVWCEEEQYEIKSVRQFSIVPDVVITISKLGDLS